MMDERTRPGADDAQLPAEALIEIARLARRAKSANGPLIRAFNKLGGGMETQLSALPPKVRSVLDGGTEGLLSGAYRAAGAVGSLKVVPETGDWGHRLAVATGGALGGFGGLATAAVELPATVALFFGAMQKIGAEYGFDPKSDKARLICLEVFGAGGPFAADDGVNSGFIGSRLAVNSGAVQAVIRRIAPAVAALLGRKLASQAVPVIGAAAGAGLNLAFLAYFREMAHVRFALERLADRHDAAAVEAQFRAEANSIGLN
ncbi:MAG TPA: EcsC family protein [Albidovulum sp.]|uniref:EcsC family protein n=1 Tax=Albidovulum sp. TaxID=1872424 RepID=UPI002BA0DE21|nr:EcsC family protein [Albidovulum sp.]